MSHTRLRSILLPLFLLFLLFAGSLLLMNSLVQRPAVQKYLLAKLSDAVGYEIDSGPIEFSLRKGIGVSAPNVHLNLPGEYNSITAARIVFSLDIGELIQGKIHVSGLTLVEPRIQIAMKEGWDPSRSDTPGLLKMIPLTALNAIPSLTLDGASITVRDIPLRGTGLFLRLVRNSIEPLTFEVTLNGKVQYRKKKVPVSARGIITCAERGGASAQWSLRISKIPLSSVTWPECLPVKQGTAGVDMRGRASLDGTFWAKGDITLQDLEFEIVDNGDRKSFAFDSLKLPFHTFYSDSKLYIPSLLVKASDFTLNVDSTLDLTDTPDPHLELNVRAPAMSYATFHRLFPSSILPPWVETRLFSIFSGGNIRVDLFSLNGKLGQLKNLDRKENAGVLLLSLTCNGLTAFKDESGIPVQAVSGKLKIKKGEIRVSEVRARFRDSRIDQGDLYLSSLYVDLPSIGVTVDGSFQLEDLMLQRNLGPVPREIRRRLRGFESATGKIDARVEIGYEPGWGFPRILEGRLDFRDCALENEAFLFPVKVDEARLTFDPEQRILFMAEGKWGRSRVLGSGVIGTAWRSGYASVILKADMDEITGHFFPELDSSMRFKNRVPSLISLSKKAKGWDFRGTFDLEDTSIETESMIISPFGEQGVVVFTGKLQPGKKFYLTNLKCSLKNSSFELAGSYDLRGGDLFDFRVSSSKLLLEDLGIRFKKGNLKGRGALQFDTSVTVSRARPAATEVTGWAKGRDLSFSASAFHHPVENCNFQVRFRGKDLMVDSLNLKLGKSPFQCAGVLRGWEGLRGDLGIRSEYLDLSDLIPEEVFNNLKGKTPLRARSGPRKDGSGARWRDGADRFMGKSDIHLDIKALKGQWEGFRYGPLRMECALRSGDLYIDRASVKIEYGKILLRGYAKRETDAKMLFSCYIDLIGQPMKELPRSLEFLTSQAEGMLTMQALIFAEGRNRADLRSSLTGTVNFMMEDGVFKKSHPVIKALDFLSLRGIFIKRPAGLSKGGVYFESMGGSIDLNKGMAKTENITMLSPVFNAVLRGDANLSTERVNAELAIKPLGTIDSLVSGIPVIGHLLTGDEEAVYVDYFKVEGPLFDPEVTYIPLKSLGNSTMGFIKRLFLSPKRLFKSISDAARDFEGRGLPLPGEEFRPENNMGG